MSTTVCRYRSERDKSSLSSIYSLFRKRSHRRESQDSFSPERHHSLRQPCGAERERSAFISSDCSPSQDKEDGRLEVREIFGMDLKASLIVLSACETGLGKLSSGDELVGLTRAFIYAGTPSVVASLWNVEDSSTAQLMASFYKNLKTMTKVEALRQAQLNLIHGNINSELLVRRGIGGVGKLGETRDDNDRHETGSPSRFI